jgi:hypothetical protein
MLRLRYSVALTIVFILSYKDLAPQELSHKRQYIISQSCPQPQLKETRVSGILLAKIVDRKSKILNGITPTGFLFLLFDLFY